MWHQGLIAFRFPASTTAIFLLLGVWAHKNLSYTYTTFNVELQLYQIFSSFELLSQLKVISFFATGSERLSLLKLQFYDEW